MNAFPFVAVILDCLTDAAKSFCRKWDFHELPGYPYRLFVSELPSTRRNDEGHLTMPYEEPPTDIRDDFPQIPLRDASVQEIQLELLRRTRHNALDGERVAESLLMHRSLWQAVMLDRFCFSSPGKLPTIGLIKLRDLPYGYWNSDSLYILTPTVEDARALGKIIKDEDWGGEVQVHDDRDDIDSALGSGRGTQALVSVWWD